jgi:hypothetical protein
MSKFAQLYDLLYEKFVGNSIYVYHRTTRDPASPEFTLFDDGFNIDGIGEALGKGFYANYDFDSTKQTRSLYGEFIIRGKTNVNNFVILDEEPFLALYPGKSFKDYINNLKLGFDYETLLSRESQQYKKDSHGNIYSAYIGRRFRRQIKEKGYKGIVYTCPDDGKSVVIYDRNNFIPDAYSTDQGETWVRMTPNVKKIISSRNDDAFYDYQEYFKVKRTGNRALMKSFVDKLFSNGRTRAMELFYVFLCTKKRKFEEMDPEIVSRITNDKAACFELLKIYHEAFNTYKGIPHEIYYSAVDYNPFYFFSKCFRSHDGSMCAQPSEYVIHAALHDNPERMLVHCVEYGFNPKSLINDAVDLVIKSPGRVKSVVDEFVNRGWTFKLPISILTAYAKKEDKWSKRKVIDAVQQSKGTQRQKSQLLHVLGVEQPVAESTKRIPRDRLYREPR